MTQERKDVLHVADATWVMARFEGEEGRRLKFMAADEAGRDAGMEVPVADVGMLAVLKRGAWGGAELEQGLAGVEEVGGRARPP